MYLAIPIQNEDVCLFKKERQDKQDIQIDPRGINHLRPGVS